MTTDKALSDQLRATTHRRPSARRRSNHQDLPTGCSTSFGGARPAHWKGTPSLRDVTAARRAWQAG